MNKSNKRQQRGNAPLLRSDILHVLSWPSFTDEKQQNKKVVGTSGNNRHVMNTYSGLSLPKNAQLEAMQIQNQGNREGKGRYGPLGRNTKGVRIRKGL